MDKTAEIEGKGIDQRQQRGGEAEEVEERQWA